MNFFSRHRPRLIIGILSAAVFATLWGEAAESVVKKDLNGDGYAEAEVFYAAGKRVEKMLIDTNHDGKTDRSVYYRQGQRERVEEDTNFDGRTDRWLTYDPTGNIWKEAFDLSAKGQPNYWRYFKEGVVYRWDRDRNLDGRPDRRTVLTNGAGRKGPRAPFLKRSYDNDFDGVFERFTGKVNPPEPLPGSLAEARYRS